MALKIIILTMLIWGTSCQKMSVPIEKKPIVVNENLSKKEIHFKKAIFNNPSILANNQGSTVIMDELITLVNATKEGSEIHLAIFLIDYDPLLEALVNSHKRGVSVQILVDQGRDESIKTNKVAIDLLKRQFSGQSRITLINSDASESSINHHKYVLFSEIEWEDKISKKMVFTTSHNFIEGGTRKLQDAIIWTDPSVYMAYLKNWHEMQDRVTIGMKNFNYLQVDFGKNIGEIHFFPRRQFGKWDGGDTILEILGEIDYTKDGTVQIAMSDWVKSRVLIAKKLIELQEYGIQIELIVKNKIDKEVQEELKNLIAAGGKVHMLDFYGKKHNIHSKCMLIDATYKGEQQKILITGTHNFTTNALRNNNEVLLLLKDENLYQDYQNYFEQIKTNFDNYWLE